MINALLKSFLAIVKKPWLIIPSAISGFIVALISFITFDAYLLMISDVIISNKIPMASLLELPFRFFELYPTETIMLLLTLAVMLLLNLLVLTIYSRFAKESIEGKASALESFAYGLSKTGSIFVLFGIIALAAIFLGAVFWAFIVFVPMFPLIGFIPLIGLLLLIYIGIKLIFTLPAFVDNEESGRRKLGRDHFSKESVGLKDAFGKSWEFTGKHFFMVIGLLIVLAVISVIGWNIAVIVSDFIEADDIATIVMYLVIAAFSCFTDLSICYYYFTNRE